MSLLQSQTPGNQLKKLVSFVPGAGSLAVKPSSPIEAAPVVVMNNAMEKEAMEGLIGAAFAERGIHPKQTRLGHDIVFRRGDPTNNHDLVRVAAHRCLPKGVRGDRGAAVRARPGLRRSCGGDRLDCCADSACPAFFLLPQGHVHSGHAH